MKIFLCTPAYGGQLHTRWFGSWMESTAAAAQAGYLMSVFLMDRDALISRARNICATTALENGFDKLMFIDNDIVWKPDQLLMLLESKREIIGGTYPIKKFPINPVFNVIKEHFDDFPLDTKNMEQYNEFVKKRADENGEVEVHHIPTGFLLIDCKVFKDLTKTQSKYESYDSVSKKRRVIYDFFPIQLVPQEGTDIKIYQTEDWGFCNAAHSAGYKIYLQTKCVVDHIGTHQYSARGYEVF